MESLKELKPQLMKDLRDIEQHEKVDISRIKNYLEILVQLADKDLEFNDEINHVEENKELSQLYGIRSNLPEEKWVKASTTPNEILKKVLKDKEENGWKFKNESSN